MTGKPFLTTERLELWQPRASDRDELHAIVTHSATRRFLGATPDRTEFFARFMRGSGSWQLYGYGLLLMRERGRREIIGNCGVFHTFRGLGEDFDDHPEAGWIVRSDKTGQGFAGEAMRAALAWFDREHAHRRMVCMISPANEPSMRLAGGLGFTPMRETILPDGDTVRLFERMPS